MYIVSAISIKDLHLQFYTLTYRMLDMVYIQIIANGDHTKK